MAWLSWLRVALRHETGVLDFCVGEVDRNSLTY